ncbi:MAG: hypothetical protein K8W52_11130 [Deltaproteobacteria bacterium]|nr:hypothetical protein [Deltaproteobacteria bacterium]
MAPRTILLCPYLTHIEPACERGLRDAEAAGYEVRRFATTAAVDRARCDAATAALADGADALLWIDSDIAFTAVEVTALCAHRLPIVAGLYPKKGVRDFAVHLERGQTELRVGAAGGLYDVRYVGAGFLYTDRVVYDDVRRTFGLPVCNAQFGSPTVPYFLPMVIADADGPPGSHWYLGEDYAFCERARQAGHKIVIDTTLRLGHIGKYTYGWEDAGQQIERVTGARFAFANGAAKRADDPTAT